jgi:hypothetical protein
VLSAHREAARVHDDSSLSVEKAHGTFKMRAEQWVPSGENCGKWTKPKYHVGDLSNSSLIRLA